MNGFKLSIDRSQMYAVLSPTKKLEHSITDIKSLLSSLEENMIKKGLLKNVILKAFADLPNLKEDKKYIIAKGKEPQNGKNGKIIFDIDVSGKSQFIAVNTSDFSGKIDYKQAMRIAEIKIGDKIGSIIPPTQGSDGFSITGKVLKAKNGKPTRVTLGEGVELAKDGISIIASKEGRPILENNKIFVSPYYEINGDVCFETGNIKFDGHVFIDGSILDGFSVEAESLEVRGNIGRADIHTKKDLLVHGGVNGHDSGMVHCDGTATLRFINHANVQVNQDLNVTKGIINSTVRCLGTITTNKIRGGTITALKGIQAITIGSVTGCPTSIEAGINYKSKEITEKLLKLDSKIENLIAQFGTNFGDQIYYDRLTSAAKQRVKDAYNTFKSYKREYLKALSNQMIIHYNTEEYPINKVIIKTKLYSDVTISTQSCYKEFTHELTGPICITENLQNKQFFTDNLTQRNKSFSPELNKPYNNAESPSYCSVNLNKLSKNSLINIDHKFKSMITDLQFHLCILEEHPIQRMRLKKRLREIGITNLIEIDDYSSIKFSLFEYNGKNIVLLHRIRDNTNTDYRKIVQLIKDSPEYFGIFLCDNPHPDFSELIRNDESICMLDADFDIELIKKEIFRFDMP